MMDTPSNFWPITLFIVFMYLVVRALINGNKAALVVLGTVGLVAVVVSFIVFA